MQSDRKMPSLKTQLITLVVSCWLIPIAAVAVIFASLLSSSYRDAIQRDTETNIQHAIRQLEIRLNTVIEDSKGVSYDGIIRSAYRSYQTDNDASELYRKTNEYLSQRFSKDDKYQAVFISFYQGVDILSYTLRTNVSEYAALKSFKEHVIPLLESEMISEDTAIRFFLIDDDLYMARNLLDGKFVPYACVVMLCRQDVLFSSFYEIPRNIITQVTIDDTVEFPIAQIDNQNDYQFEDYSTTIDGHTITLTSAYEQFNLWRDVPTLKFGILAAAALGVPMLLIAMLFFYRQITKPTNSLLRASEKIQQGERGYLIEEKPGNEEFRQLVTHFNDMSSELKEQFEQIYLEQESLQQAEIKALQSQINPHFLNNTLEVINWEARMGNNEKVSAMIEALSTMLSGALNRDGKEMITLEQELEYVDAYLYIIRQRLGDHFVTERELEPGIENAVLPRLILQPIVENAVEHDITPNGGGLIRIKAHRHDGMVIIETIHSGVLSDADRKNIQRTIAETDTKNISNVGLENVVKRMRLIYGDEGWFSYSEAEGLLTFRLFFPDKQVS